MSQNARGRLPFKLRLLSNSSVIACGLVMAFGLGSAEAESLTWDSDPGDPGIQSGSGDWEEGSGSEENWQTSGGSNTNFDDGDDVTFGDPGGSVTIILQENVSPASLTFDAGGYTIDGSVADHMIEVDGGTMQVSVASGTTTIDAGISNKGTVEISGAGSLTLSGTNTDEGAPAAGTYDIDGGNLVITGATAAEDVVENNSGTLLIDGGGTVQGTVTNNAGSFTNADGDVEGLTTVENGSVLATGGDFTGGVQLNNGMMIIQADTSAEGISVGTGLLLVQSGNTLDSGVQMTGNGDIDNYGTVEGNVNLLDGTFENGFGPSLQTGTIDGAVTINGSGATFNNYDGSSVGNLVTVNAGSLNAQGGSFSDILVNGGTMAVFADTQANVVTIQSGDIDILSGQELDAMLNIEGGEVENFNLATMSGTVTLDDGDSDPATGGTLIGSGGNFEDVIVNDGTFDVDADTQADSVKNNGGRIEIDGTNITLTTDYTQTGGTTIIENGGELADADGLTVSGGELQNGSGGTITGDVAVSGGELLADGGTFNDDVTVSGTGTFNVDANTSVGTTTITGGDIDIAGGARLETNLVQSGGTTIVNVNGELDDTDDSVDLSGGTLINQGTVSDDIRLTGDATLVADGGVFGGAITMLSVDTVFDVNASTLIVSPITITNGTVNINGTSTLTNDIDLGNGAVNVGANATLNDVGGTNLVAGTLANAGTVTQQVTVSNGGSLDIAGGTFTNGVVANGGNILISEDTALDLTNNGSDIVIESGDTLTDDVVNNSGTIVSAGTISGTLDITGGTVTQNEAGLGDPVGGVSGAVTVNNGGQLIANGGDFSAGITAETGGIVQIGGEIVGDVINEAGTVTITATGVLDGDLTMEDTPTAVSSNDGTIRGAVDVEDGTFQNNGTIEGAGASNGATVSGGNFYNNDGGDIDSSVAVVGGTFWANGGNVVDRAVVTDTGQFVVSANSSGDVTNGTAGGGMPAGGMVTINSGSILTGDITNNSGQTRIHGGLNGALSVEDGQVDISDTSTGVTELVSVNGGKLNLDGGTFESGISAANGTTTVSGAITVGAGAFLAGTGGEIVITNNGVVQGNVSATDVAGTDDLLTNEGEISGAVTVSGTTTSGQVAFDNQGSVGGDVSVSAGVAQSSGTIDGGVNVSGVGEFTLLHGSVRGASSVTGGRFRADGGSFASVRNDGGDVLVTGSVSGDVFNERGNASLAAGVTLTGGITNSGAGVFTLGESSGGAATIDGTLNVSGGNADVVGGSEVTGLVSVTGGVLTATNGTFSGGIDNSGGDIVIAGVVSGSIRNVSGEAEFQSGARFTGNVSNADILKLAGVLSGDLSNTDGGAVTTTTDVSGIQTLGNAGSGTITVSDGNTLAAQTINNGGTISVGVGSTLLGTGNTMNNSGDIIVAGNGALIEQTGDFNNLASGEVRFVGAADKTLDVQSGVIANAGVMSFEAGETQVNTGGTAIENSGWFTFEGSASLNASGETIVNSGTIRMNTLTALTAESLTNTSGGMLDLAGMLSGDLTNENGGVVTTSGDVSGIGALTHSGAGGFTISTAHSLTADSFENNGALTIQSGGTIYASSGLTNSAVGTMVLSNGASLVVNGNGVSGENLTNNGAILIGTGQSSFVVSSAGAFINNQLLDFAPRSSLSVAGDFTNGGMVNMSNGVVGDTILVDGDFTGGGAFTIDVDFTGDTADQIYINGDVLGGTSLITISDVSTGEHSGHDVVIASVTGAAADGAFRLSGPVSSGARLFEIVQVGTDFVLIDEGAFVGEVVGLEALSHTLLTQNNLPDLRRRQGARAASRPGEIPDTAPFWFSVGGDTVRFSPTKSATSYKGESERFGLQAGINAEAVNSESGRLIVGTHLSYNSTQSDVRSSGRNAAIDSDAYAFGVSATWYAQSGLYADGQLQYSVYDVALVSDREESMTDGVGYAGAYEIGKRYEVERSGWTVTPKGRFVYTKVDYDDFVSGGGLQTSLENAERLRVGAGMSVEKNAVFGIAKDGNDLSVYASALIYADLSDDMKTKVDDSLIASQAEDWVGEIGIGVQRNFAGEGGSLFGEVTYSPEFENSEDNAALSVAFGGRLRF